MEANLIELRERMARGETTARAAAQTALDAAEKLNDTLNAFLEIDPQGALLRADAIDIEPDKSRLPLAGVPLAIKDNICFRGLKVSGGSRILGAHKQKYCP